MSMISDEAAKRILALFAEPATGNPDSGGEQWAGMDLMLGTTDELVQQIQQIVDDDLVKLAPIIDPDVPDVSSLNLSESFRPAHVPKGARTMPPRYSGG